MDAGVPYDCGEAEVGDADYTDGEADLVVLTSPSSWYAYNITLGSRILSI
jgi:hypothetical protein